MTKKLTNVLAIVLVLLLLTGSVRGVSGINERNDQAFSLNINTVSCVAVGDTVRLALSIPANMNISLLQFTVRYDSTKLRVKSAARGTAFTQTPGSGAPTINIGISGKIVCSWDTITTPLNTAGSLLTMDFEILTDLSEPTAVYVDRDAKYKVLDETYAEIPTITTAGSVKTGHIFDAGSVSAQATCTEAGEIVYTCTGCGTTTSQSIPALGHDYIYSNNGETHSVGCARCNMSVTQEHSFSNGSCICGAEIRIASAYLHLDENINMVYSAEIPEYFERPYMVFNFHNTNCTENTFSISSDGKHCFELAEINPQCMGDNISATLYATYHGTTVSVTKAEYSVRDYCANLLAEEQDDAVLITLLSDILTYGAAAQNYTNYATDALVTEGQILSPRPFSELSGKAASFIGEQDNNTFWVAASLVLSNDLATRFSFITDSTAGLTVEVSINGRSQTFDAFETGENGAYFITFDSIMATEFDDAVTAKFYRNGTQIGATVVYSVNTYICMTQNSTNSRLALLVQALYNYGASAEDYAVSLTN